MAVARISLQDFFNLHTDLPILDVRSPSEYTHVHIPGALSFPLFTDEERKVVGTTYKQINRQAAIKIGLDYFGPKMRSMIEEVEKTNAKAMIVHCWRGGMRSAAVAWLLDLYGFKVYVLEGGYKTFRKWALEQLNKPYPFCLIAGYTGSGKTGVLQELGKRGHAIIDLEGIAQHKGSAFGGLDKIPQPSTEMFENLLALQLYKLSKENPGRPIWVEDESQRIGDLNMPHELWQYFRTQPLYFLDIPFEERLSYLVEEYGHHTKEQLINAIVRIRKRLGPMETKTAVNCLIEDDVRGCFNFLLKYYDKQYHKALTNREHLQELMITVAGDTVDPINNTIRILNKFNESGN